MFVFDSFGLALALGPGLVNESQKDSLTVCNCAHLLTNRLEILTAEGVRIPNLIALPVTY